MSKAQVLKVFKKRHPASEVSVLGKYSIDEKLHYGCALIKICDKNEQGYVLRMHLVMAIVVYPTSLFSDLRGSIEYLTSLIHKEHFDSGEIAFISLDTKGKSQDVYSLQFMSKYILNPFFITDSVGNQKWGYGVDYFEGHTSKHKTAISPIYESVTEFKSGLAAVKKDGKWGYIEGWGNTVIPFDYEEAGRHSYTCGQFEIPYNFQSDWSNKIFKSAPVMMNSIAAVKKAGKWGYIDRNGVELIPFIYDGAKRFNRGIAGVKKGSSWGFIDLHGKELTQFIYEEVQGIYNLGLAPVKQNGKWGFVSVMANKMIIEPMYDFIFCLEYESFAVVQQGSKWGLIDSRNNKFDKHKVKVNMLLYDCLEEVLIH